MLSLWKAFLLAIVTLPFSTTAVQSGHTQHEARTNTIHQVRNENYRENTRSGPLALARAYRKYGKPVPEPLARVLSSWNMYKRDNETSSVAASPEEWDSEYLTPVSVGTPPQNFNVTIDTGSSDFWLFSTELAQQEGGVALGRDALYDPAKSQSATLLQGYFWNISYGDGSGASGNVYTDVLTVGNISALNQSVGAASQVSAMFIEDAHNDGILGLAFPDLNTVEPVQQDTFFGNVMDSLQEPLFAVDLKYNETGSYDFGAIDESKYEGNITYTAVNTSLGLWEFSSDRYKIGDKTYEDGSVDGIADTGTTLLLLPDDVVVNYYEQVEGALYLAEYAGFVFPCGTDLPSFTYTISTNGSDSGKDIVIPGLYMTFSPADDLGGCYGAIQSSDGLGVNIYGDVALKAAYVVFRGGDSPELGFASKAQ